MMKRFWDKVDKTDGCWLWQSTTTTAGYPVLKIGRKQFYAHRLSYEWAVGPIPEGLEMDHLCRVRECVNPEHLEAVTHQVNMSRRVHSPLCPQGHNDWHPEPWHGVRVCRTCKREQARVRYNRQRMREVL